MSRVEAMREKLPKPLRPFTRGVWPFVWVTVAALGGLWIVGAETFDQTLAMRESSATQRRLVSAMRDSAASEPAEQARFEELAAWARESAPARVRATSVEIGISRLQERVQEIVASVGEGARVQSDVRGAPPVETLIESMPGGRSLHMVRIPLAVQTETMDQMARLIAALESNPDVWLRPGNASLKAQRVRQGQAVRLDISQMWALIEVVPEDA
ncbi:MAG: hypothetical protein ACTS27_06255 [Phycisphaerales bacterium]